jgi:ABC-2 type transport system ATP-binding protein
MDEIYASDKVVLIHQGALRAEGSEAEISLQAKTDNITDAFFK